MRLKMYCWFGLGLYGLLSAADLVLTFSLLRANRAAYESNPAAAACLERYGWGGLALYKAAGVSVFMAAVIMLLFRRRPGIGAALVTLGCSVLLSVNTYTHNLLKDGQEDPDISLGIWEQEGQPSDEIAAFGEIPERCWFAEN